MPSRRNRKIKKHSNGIRSIPIFVCSLFTLVGAFLLSWWLDQNCSQQQRALNEKETELKALEEEYAREQVKWDNLTSPKNIDRALLRHGLAMDAPSAGQIVRMDAKGKPKAGQLSVARLAAERSRRAPLASNSRSGGARRRTRR